MNNTADTIARNVLFLMKERGISTPTELARLSGLNQPTVHRILKKESADPKLSNLKALAEALDVSYWKLTENYSCPDLLITSRDGSTTAIEVKQTRTEQQTPSHATSLEKDLLAEVITLVENIKTMHQLDISSRDKAEAIVDAYEYIVEKGLKSGEIMGPVQDALMAVTNRTA